MDHQIIAVNQNSASSLPLALKKSPWIRKLCIVLLFLASTTIFLYLLTESIRVYWIIQTNQMIREQISVSLAPVEGAYKSKHHPVGVNKDYKYDLAGARKGRSLNR